MEALHTLMAPQTEQSRKRLVQGLVTAKVRSREERRHLSAGLPDDGRR